ncbi:MAG: GNAT family N-acetyltransferase [Bacteroides sp.]|nr:GNAT family N-acetyltransferase [Bacteroides sp.]
MQTIVRCNKEDYATLSSIWERSVRATHDFLDEDTIEEIKAALEPSYFPNVELYAVSHNGSLTGFIGLRNDMIEMLFIDIDSRGQGYGSSLIEFAFDRGATKVDVNEQNPMALAFYRSKGFKIIGKDAVDEAGRPYPILHLSL